MANYRTHVTGGILAAGLVSFAAYRHQLVPWPLLPITAAITVVGSLLPDLDSDSSHPQRIVFSLLALSLPPALIWRFEALRPERPLEWVALLALALFIRWPVLWAFRKLTVHRGIFHSLPAVVIVSGAVYHLSASEGLPPPARVAFAVAAATGYATHLILDEIWSLADWHGGRLAPRKSLGTALALWGSGPRSSLVAWLLAAAITWSVKVAHLAAASPP